VSRNTAAEPVVPISCLPRGWRLEVEESVTSTSDVLRERALAGEAAPLALLARRQTAGRGRSGRHWASPDGNLHLSILLRPASPPQSVGQWALLAGIALAEIAALQDPEPMALRLKWPNDLLRHGAKVAGILAEGQIATGGEGPRPSSLDWLILGIGANLAVAPSLPDRPSAVLVGAGTPEEMAKRLIWRLQHWIARHSALGFAPVREAWLRRGPAPGEVLSVRIGETRLQGCFAGLAEDGGLLLDTAGGRRHILAGEVLAFATEPHFVPGCGTMRTGL
jgi:BirA family biotin operon repressor/biotin-[acetyl-CoA-carboxylase] ligase